MERFMALIIDLNSRIAFEYFCDRRSCYDFLFWTWKTHKNHDDLIKPAGAYCRTEGTSFTITEPAPLTDIGGKHLIKKGNLELKDSGSLLRRLLFRVRVGWSSDFPLLIFLSAFLAAAADTELPKHNHPYMHMYIYIYIPKGINHFVHSN